MGLQVNGEMIPIGGGDTIPLVRPKLSIGRRDTCDICLRFPNISGQHCELMFREGFWFIKDLGSTNGTKVNGQRVTQKLLRPGDEISFAKRRYTIKYEMPSGPVPEDCEDSAEDITSQSLLEKAGLVRPPRPMQRPKAKPLDPGAFLREEEDDE